MLKTRSTLSLHKVYKYLVKKLEETNYEDESNEAPIEQSVIIICNGEVLSTSLQLKSVKDQFWPFEDKLLTLNYKRKDTQTSSANQAKSAAQSANRASAYSGSRQSMLTSSSGLKRTATSSFVGVNYRPRKPPVWVPDHLAFNCKSCDVEFSSLMNRLHHCRNCGRCFCANCSNHFVPIPDFGYFEPARVCFECRNELQMQ